MRSPTLLYILFFIFLGGLVSSQCAYYTDSLTGALAREKSAYQRSVILLSLSEEWRERDKSVSQVYFERQNTEFRKISKASELADYLLLRSYIYSNKNDLKSMKADLDSAAVFILSLGDEYLLAKYRLAWANYFRQDHEETDENHRKIVETIKSSAEVLKKYSIDEAAKAYYLLVTFYAKEHSDTKGLNDYLSTFESLVLKMRNPRLQAKYYQQAGLLHRFYTRKTSESFRCYSSALKYFGMARDSLGISAMLIETGGSYNGYGEKEKGLKQISEGIAIASRHSAINPKKSNQNVTEAYVFLGQNFAAQKQKEKAYDAYKKAIYYNNLAGNARNEPLLLGDLSVLYARFGMPDTALMYERKALSLRLKFGITEGEIFSYGNLSHIYFKKGEYDSAIAYGNKSLELAQKHHMHSYDKNAYGSLMQTYEAKKDFEKAFYYLDRYHTVIDSLTKLRNDREAQKLIGQQKEELAKAEFDRQQAITKAELQMNKFLVERKEKELLLLDQENNLKAYRLEKSKSELFRKQLESDIHKKEAEALNAEKLLQAAEAKRKESVLKQQKIVIYAVSIGAMLAAGLLLVAVRAYSQKKKDRDLIEKQKREVEEQKKLVETKQKEVLDSIRYAKRIQMALIPAEKNIGRIIRKLNGKA